MANVALPTNAVDLEGLGDLRRRAQRDDASALADVAVQFEALFIGMMLESARSASLGGGLFDGAETEQYLALMDRQVALEMARHGGFGFGKLLEQQLGSRERRDGRRRAAPQRSRCRAPARSRRRAGSSAPAGPAAAAFPQGLPSSLAALGGAAPSESPAEPTPAEFVSALAARSQGGGRGARRRAALAACPSGARDGLGPRGAATRRRIGAQRVRHQGRSVLVRRRRRAVDARARGRRDGAAARAVQGLRQHGRELRRLRRSDRHGSRAMRKRSRRPTIPKRTRAP